MHELAKKLQITPASASTLADRLIETGWVERHTDEKDRRIIHLQLRPKSKRKMQDMMDGHSERIEEVMNHLSLHDRQTLLRILRILQDHAANEQSAN